MVMLLATNAHQLAMGEMELIHWSIISLHPSQRQRHHRCCRRAGVWLLLPSPCRSSEENNRKNHAKQRQDGNKQQMFQENVREPYQRKQGKLEKVQTSKRKGGEKDDKILTSTAMRLAVAEGNQIIVNRELLEGKLLEVRCLMYSKVEGRSSKPELHA